MLDIEKGGDAVSGHTGDRTIAFRRREPARGEGSGAAGVSCSAVGCLKPAGQTTCMEAVARSTPTFTRGAHGAAVLRRI